MDYIYLVIGTAIENVLNVLKNKTIVWIEVSDARAFTPVDAAERDPLVSRNGHGLLRHGGRHDVNKLVRERCLLPTSRGKGL